MAKEKTENATTDVINLGLLEKALIPFKAKMEHIIDVKIEEYVGDACPIPVGAYIETSKAPSAWNPGTEWPGTSWDVITDGTVLRAGGATTIVGSDTHQLTVDEMPSHNHYSVDTYLPIYTQDPHGPTVMTNSMSYAYQSINTAQWTSIQGGSASHSILQKSQNCWRYRRRAA